MTGGNIVQKDTSQSARVSQSRTWLTTPTVLVHERLSIVGVGQCASVEKVSAVTNDNL